MDSGVVARAGHRVATIGSMLPASGPLETSRLPHPEVSIVVAALVAAPAPGDLAGEPAMKGQRTHESVRADVHGDGDIDILTKPRDGDLHLFAENLLISK